MLKSFDWKSEYETGVREIDEQHRHYIYLVNKVYQSLDSKNSDEQIEKLIDQIFEHVTKHFSTEEEYFDKANYKYAKEHKADHRKLIVDSLEFKYKFQTEHLKVVPEFMEFLEKWMIEHITVFDKKYQGQI